jgi:site-specific recombinase XerD
MLTGQRVEEIAALHVDQWKAEERIIDWSKTKNGKPHAIPVPRLAAELLSSIIPNQYGWFFPSAKDPSRPVFLNVGQGVANDAWVGRGSCSNQPQDYAEYAKGADIVSFDCCKDARLHAGGVRHRINGEASRLP